jgi:hypothetical protein
MVIGAGDDHVGIEIGGPREQHVGHRQIALQGAGRINPSNISG